MAFIDPDNVKEDGTFIDPDEQPTPVEQPTQQSVSQRSGFSDFTTGLKRGLAGVVAGIGQRTGLVSQSDIDMFEGI